MLIFSEDSVVYDICLIRWSNQTPWGIDNILVFNSSSILCSLHKTGLRVACFCVCFYLNRKPNNGLLQMSRYGCLKIVHVYIKKK